jgi:hypothetical protein
MAPVVGALPRSQNANAHFIKKLALGDGLTGHKLNGSPKGIKKGGLLGVGLAQTQAGSVAHW